MNKRIFSALLACILALSLFGTCVSAASASGSCGKNVRWSFDENTCVLTISGQGPMDDFWAGYDASTYGFASNVPWWAYRRLIQKVVVEEGVTSVGDNAFCGDYTDPQQCFSFSSLVLADSVTSIGESAFSGCRLQTVLLGAGLQSIGSYAFFVNFSLRSITLPEGLTTIGEGAFIWTGLTEITIPRSVTSIGEEAFGHNYSVSGAPAVLVGFTVSGYKGSAAEAYYEALLSRYDYEKEHYAPYDIGNNYPADGTVYFKAFLPAAVNVTVGGAPVFWTDAAPFIDENSRTMVPLRAVAEALGLSVSWDGAQREAVFTDGSKTLYFPIGSSSARTGDGSALQMDTAAVIVNDRTYAPVRYLAEYFGFTVGWDGASKTVLIQKGGDGGLDSASVVWTRMNHSYWFDTDDDAPWGSGSIFVNRYYDLASITDDTPLKEQINAALRGEYEVFALEEGPYNGGYDEGDTNYIDARSGEIAQNADGILSLKYCTEWWMGGVGDGSMRGITVSLRTGKRLYLSDLASLDGRQITFEMLEQMAVDYYEIRGAHPWQSQLDSFHQQTLDDLDFYIENNQIILCIEKYALAEGAAGAAEIPTGIFVRER